MNKLPVSYIEQPNGECWTFYKFAILKAHPVATPWLATHVEFYINENMCGGYGNADCDYYRMRYYSDILSMTRIPVSDVTDDEIVSTICEEIDKGHYIVIYLNFNRIFRYNDDLRLHELLVYGYDKEREVFYCPMLTEGSFKEAELPFETIRLAYKDARDCYMQDGWRLLMMRSYYFGITAIRVRRDYLNDNFAADLIDKIDHELHGMRIIQTDLMQAELQDRICYTGIACYTGLSSCINSALTEGVISKTMLFRLIRTLKMMCDYRKLFQFAMDWFAETVKGENDSELLSIRSRYSACADEVQRCYLMLCKYTQKENARLLESVRLTLDELRIRESEILSTFRELIFKYYYQMTGVPVPPED